MFHARMARNGAARRVMAIDRKQMADGFSKHAHSSDDGEYPAPNDDDARALVPPFPLLPLTLALAPGDRVRVLFASGIPFVCAYELPEAVPFTGDRVRFTIGMPFVCAYGLALVLVLAFGLGLRCGSCVVSPRPIPCPPLPPS